MFDGLASAFFERTATPYATHHGHIAPDVVMMRDGSLCAVIEVEGYSFELAGNAALNSAHAVRAELLRNIAEPELTVYEHLIQHDSVRPLPPTEHRTFYGAALARDYQACLAGLRGTSWFLTLIVRPRAPLALRRRKSGRDLGLDRRLSMLQDKARSAMSALAAWQPRRLGVREEGGVLFSEIAEAHRMTLYARWMPVPLVEGGQMGAALYNDRVTFADKAFRVEVPARDYAECPHGLMLGFRIYPTRWRVGMFDPLIGQPFRFVLTNSYQFFGRTSASDKMALRARHMSNAGDRAVSLRLELDEAMDAVDRGEHVLGEHLWSLAVHADRLADLEEWGARARNAVTDAGAVVATEDAGVEGAFWAQLPGSPHYLRARAGGLPSVAFAAMSSMHAHPKGDTRHHWGQPLYRVRTIGNTPYEVPWHLRDVGHRLRFGPTGSGKTLDMAFDAVMLDPLVGGQGGSQIIFDKDGANEILVRAMGGPVARIRRGQDSGVAPLRGLENTEANRAWLHEFISGLIMADGRGALRPDSNRRLDKGIAWVMRMPPAMRSLAGIRQFLDHGDALGDGARLEVWCRGNARGWAFDGEADRLDFDAPFASVDPSEVLDDAAVMPPLAAYLLYRTGLIADGRRVVVHADEGRAYMPPVALVNGAWEMRFARGFEDLVLTGRKKEVSLDLAIQQPEHILDHPVGASLIAQAKTRVLYANPDARRDSYVEGLGCSPRIHEAVSRDTLVGPRSKILMRETYAVRCIMDLGPLREHLAVLSSRTSTIKLMADTIGNHGSDPAVWLPIFWQRLREGGPSLASV